MGLQVSGRPRLSCPGLRGDNFAAVSDVLQPRRDCVEVCPAISDFSLRTGVDGSGCMPAPATLSSLVKASVARCSIPHKSSASFVAMLPPRDAGESLVGDIIPHRESASAVSTLAARDKDSPEPGDPRSELRLDDEVSGESLSLAIFPARILAARSFKDGSSRLDPTLERVRATL